MMRSSKRLLVSVLLCSVVVACSDSQPAGSGSGGGVSEPEKPDTGGLTAPVVTDGRPAVGELVINSGPLQGLITRLSDSDKRPASNGLNLIKSDYSRVQAENADGSRLLVLAVNASGLVQYALLSPEGGEPTLIDLPEGNAAGIGFMHDETEARWHPSDPDKIRFIQGQNSYLGSLKVFEYDIAADSVSVLADLAGKLPPAWGGSLYGMTAFEGTFSRDGNRLAWIVETGVGNAETTVGYVAFDLLNGGTVLGTLDYDGRDHDHLSISPSGQYVVISAANKTTVHPVDFSTETVLQNETQHSDLCVTASGDDCYVAVAFDDSDHPHYGWVFMTNLVSGETTPLVDIFGTGNTSLHLSGRALERPGWVLMSSYNCSAPGETALCDRLNLIELAPNPRIIDLTASHSTGGQYYAEPHGTINRDGTRAYFNSDWDDAGSVNVYRLEIPTSLYAP